MQFFLSKLGICHLLISCWPIMIVFSILFYFLPIISSCLIVLFFAICFFICLTPLLNGLARSSNNPKMSIFLYVTDFALKTIQKICQALFLIGVQFIISLFRCWLLLVLTAIQISSSWKFNRVDRNMGVIGVRSSRGLWERITL